MDRIQVIEFPFDTSGFPASLYGTKSFNVGNIGLRLPVEFKYETEKLMQEFLSVFQLQQEGVYLRLDLFVDPSLETVHLLEVNSRLVDGWGAAFSLARAGGRGIAEVSENARRARFPRLWHLPLSNRVYRNDFDFTLQELDKLGVQAAELATLDGEVTREWIYYYGWDRPEMNDILLAPSLGYEIENKIHLARFSRSWAGKLVKVPRGYSICTAAWEDIPRENVIFKFCEKHSEDSDRAKTSVLYPNEVGKGRFARQCYARGTIVAQDIVSSLEDGERVCQLILLTNSASVIAGYVLWAPRGTRIITDAYEHAPLVWS